MAESFVQLPADGTGRKLRTRQEVIGGNTVETQYVAQAAPPTFSAWTGPVAFAQNKHFLSIFNAAGSGRTVKVRKLFLQNLQLAAVTGVGVQFDLKRTSAQSGGTAITMLAADTQDAVPAQSVVAVASGATVTEGGTLFGFATTNDEVGATTAAIVGSLVQAGLNLLPEGPEIKEINLRPGEGLTVKMVTASTVGSFGVLAVLAVE